MTSIKRRGPAYQATGKLGKLMRVYGVPSFYWGLTDRSIGNPITFHIDREWAKEGRSQEITPSKQQKVIDEIFRGNLLKETSMVVGVGSCPTDMLGIAFGAAVVARAIELEIRPLMINICDRPEALEIQGTPDVVVFHNINSECNQGRVDACRHWLSWFDDTFVVAVLGGSNPLSFFYNRLHSRIDAALYFEGDTLVEND
jgi:hypothetical protein